MKKLLLIALLFPCLSWADKLVVLPEGGTCWLNERSGTLSGCEIPTPAEKAREAEQFNAEGYNECVKESYQGFTSKPSARECAIIYKKPKR